MGGDALEASHSSVGPRAVRVLHFCCDAAQKAYSRSQPYECRHSGSATVVNPLATSPPNGEVYNSDVTSSATSL